MPLVSGRYFVTWNPLVADLQVYDSGGGILLEGRIIGFNEQVHLLNIYGPYDNHRVFWEATVNSGLLLLPNLIMGGDLNFTQSSKEVWRKGLPCDSLSSFFISMFGSSKLQDIARVLSPTW